MPCVSRCKDTRNCEGYFPFCDSCVNVTHPFRLETVVSPLSRMVGPSVIMTPGPVTESVCGSIPSLSRATFVAGFEKDVCRDCVAMMTLRMMSLNVSDEDDLE